MSIFNCLYHLVRADFYERVRRYSFFIVVAFTVYLGIMSMPALDANYITVSINSSRGIYNSAWVGTMFAMMLSVIAPLAGFFIIRTSIERDRHTRVGAIIASTQVSNLTYLVGKALSNFAVLLTMMAIVMMVAPIMQIIRAESLAINLLDIWTPIVLMFVPLAALVAVVGILFEVIPFLRYGMGNIIYVVGFIALFVASEAGTSSSFASIDPIGLNASFRSIEQAYETQIGETSAGINIGFTVYDDETKTTFEWQGLQWTFNMIMQRFIYIFVAFGLILPTALFFDRFDNNHSTKKQSKRKSRANEFQIPFINDEQSKAINHSVKVTQLTPLKNHRYHLRFFSIVMAELKLFMKGQSRWLLLTIIGLNIAIVFSSTSIVVSGLMPVLWLLPILIWSQLGVREYLNNTHQIIFSVAHPIRGQFIGLWVASLIFTVLVGSGAAIHFVLHNEFGYLLGWVATVLFIPSFALACGVLTNSKRLFEVSYLLLWYIAINEITIFDFMSHTATSIEANIPIIYLLIGVSLFLLALFKRRLSLGV